MQEIMRSTSANRLSVPGIAENRNACRNTSTAAICACEQYEWLMGSCHAPVIRYDDQVEQGLTLSKLEHITRHRNAKYILVYRQTAQRHKMSSRKSTLTKYTYMICSLLSNPRLNPIILREIGPWQALKMVVKTQKFGFFHFRWLQCNKYTS